MTAVEWRPAASQPHYAGCDDPDFCDRHRHGGPCLFDEDPDPRRLPTTAAPVELPDEVAVAFAVVERLIRAERAATRVLLTDLRPPTPTALAGMVDRVIGAGPDRWTAMRWLEERLALHTLTRQLAEQAATTILERTLAALPAPPGDARGAVVRLRDAQVRAYGRTLGAAWPQVREHLNDAWLDAVGTLPPLTVALVPMLGVARQWLSDSLTAEQHA